MPETSDAGAPFSAAASLDELPETGSATDVGLPLGAALLAAGLGMLAAARRRAARLAHIRR
jgi:LPXTG-motif cell wall-anchored protein